MNATIRTMARSANAVTSSFIRHVWPGLFMILALALLPGEASAADVVQCLGTQTVEYSPGLTLTPKNTAAKVRDDLPICTGVSDPPVAAATRSSIVMLTTSCLDLLGGPPGIVHADFTWDTGDTSTFSYSVSVQRTGTIAIVTMTGEITAGLFEGASVVAVSSYVSPNILACLGPPGVSELSGPLLFTLTLVE